MNMSEADKMAFFQTNAEHVFKIPHAKPWKKEAQSQLEKFQA
jgi:hypothetical protein